MSRKKRHPEIDGIFEIEPGFKKRGTGGPLYIYRNKRNIFIVAEIVLN
jgi:hypothetical protein